MSTLLEKNTSETPTSESPSVKLRFSQPIVLYLGQDASLEARLSSVAEHQYRFIVGEEAKQRLAHPSTSIYAVLIERQYLEESIEQHLTLLKESFPSLPILLIEDSPSDQESTSLPFQVFEHASTNNVPLLIEHITIAVEYYAQIRSNEKLTQENEKLLQLLNRSRERQTTLSNSAKVIASSRDEFTAIVTATDAILRQVQVNLPSKVSMIFRERQLNGAVRYVNFQIPVEEGEDGRLLKFDNIQQIHHSSSSRSFAGERKTQISKQCTLQGSLLEVPIWYQEDVVGCIEISNVNTYNFKEADRKFVDILSQALAISFENINFNFELSRAIERTISMRKFANRIGEFKEEENILHAALEEVCRHVYVTNAFIFFNVFEAAPRRHHQQNREFAFLNQLPIHHELSELFDAHDEELVLINHINSDHPLLSHYSELQQQGLTDGHFVFIRSALLSRHAICLFRDSGQRPFDSASLEYLKSMINQINLARENIDSIRETTRMEQELKNTAVVQRALFPKKLPQLDNLEVASFFRSASETGGDWYGFIQVNEKELLVLIGDVTGHGTPSTMVTATVCATCRMLEKLHRDQNTSLYPTELLEHLNQAIFEVGHPDFWMTFFAAHIQLDTGLLTFANAAHNFPFLVRADGTIKHLYSQGFHLGSRPHTDFKERTLQLHQGDVLFFYTDGLVENSNDGEAWGERRLNRYLKAKHRLPMQRMVDQLNGEILQFHQDTPLEDDVMVVACRYLKNSN